MIEFITGDMLKTKAQALVNTVNCEGYMGKGIAYQFKLEYPENFKIYQSACSKKQFRPGDILIHRENNKIVVNFPTKDKWRQKSEYRYIESGLDELIKKITEYNITSIAIPPLGCGNGGLDWRIVRELINSKLETVNNLVVYVYEPSKYYESKSKQAPKLSLSHCILMEVKKNLKKFSKLRLQKTAYLINILNGSDYFNFDAYKFGPYSHAIEVLSKSIKEFQDYYSLKTPDALDIAIKTLTSNDFDRDREKFNILTKKATKIVNEISSNEYLELFTSIIFLIKKLQNPTYEQLVVELNSWSERKRLIAENLSIEECIIDIQNKGLIKLNVFGQYELCKYVILIKQKEINYEDIS